jgi:hypothetical protein
VENETRNWLPNLDANFYAEGILKLVSCVWTCLEIMWRNKLKVSFILACVFRKLE